MQTAMASGSPDAQWKKIKDIATAQRTCTNSEGTILCESL